MTGIGGGSRAPGFGLPLVEGGVGRLEDLLEAGGGVLLFVKGGCPASELVTTRIKPLAGALAREERPLFVVYQGDGTGARAFREEQAGGLAVAYDTEPFEASRAYGIRIVPTLVVLDGAGFVAERLEGFVKSEYLALGLSLEQALALGDIPPVLERPEELPAAKAG